VAVSTATAFRTLVLSQGYEPIKVISWQRAIALLSLGKIEVIEEYEHNVKSVSLVIKIPAVVRLLRAFRRHKQKVKFSRVNIFARDKYSCQYCGKKGKINELTYDHVVPRSQGGKTEWTNIATCCYDCNAEKRDRTPAQAGMRLRNEPAQPTWIPAMTITVSTTSAPDAWRDYVYWTSDLTEQPDE
jgi:5-methylcytosine-specific restriction endonuclease McrA